MARLHQGLVQVSHGKYGAKLYIAVRHYKLSPFHFLSAVCFPASREVRLEAMFNCVCSKKVLTITAPLDLVWLFASLPELGVFRHIKHCISGM